jgi:uncharacterized membrane protein
MRMYIVYAILAGVAWGVGGYFEKTGLRALGMPPIVGITLRTMVALLILGAISLPAWSQIRDTTQTASWWMIILGGGVIAGAFGMWSFYAALETTENLGVTLAVAFALAPISGTVIGLVTGTQSMDLRTAVGLLAIIGGIILLQLSRASTAR